MRSSVISDAFAAARPCQHWVPECSAQVAVTKLSPRLRRISILSPCGFPAGYSGRSAGNIVSRICSAAYL